MLKLHRMIVVSVIFSGTMAFAAEPPTVNVPQVDSPPRIDGTVGDDEWKQAAVLRNFPCKVEGITTTVYVQYDAEAFFIGARMTEVEPGYPQAFKRQPGEAFIDDALMVGIGLDGATSERLSMGGYEGARGELGSVHVLYKFIVNAAGSMRQQYDECPMQAVSFQAKTTQSDGGWSVEMRIPFTAIGLEEIPQDGMVLHFNAVRFRPPQRIAWCGMNAWLGFQRFQTGRMTLLPKNTPDQATREARPAEKPAETTAEKPDESFTPQLGYYPLAHAIVALFDLPGPATVELSHDGTLLKTASFARSGPHRLSVSTDNLDIQQGQTLTLKIIPDHSPPQVHTATVASTPEIPDWNDSKAGLAYARRKTPGPWMPPVIEDSTIVLSHSRIRLGHNALPSSVTGRAGELLAKPVELILKRDGQPLDVAFNNPATLTLDGHAVRAVAEGAIQDGGVLRILSQTDFDGFTAVQFQVDCEHPVDTVQLTATLTARAAQFINLGHAQTTYKLGANPYANAFGGMLWIGGPEMGLTLSDDQHAVRSLDTRHQLRIEPLANHERRLVLTLTDRPDQLESTQGVLQFNLQPTPVRPPSRATDRDYTLLNFESWSDYQGYPDLSKMEEVRAYIKESRDKKKVPLLYFSQMLAENSPGFATFRNELIAPPERMWYKRAYDPGKGVPCYVCCVRGPYGDLLLDGISKFQQAGLGGIYMDGTTTAWGCTNPSHNACTSSPPATFGTIQDGRIIGTRTFMKRLRGIFNEDDLETRLVSHTGGGLDPHTLALVDMHWEGEWLAARLPDHYLPLHKFVVGYSGAPWGWRTMFYSWHWCKGRGDNFPLLYGLLHGSDVLHGRAASWYEDYGPAWTLLPYWQDDRPVKWDSQTGNSVVSVYPSGEKPLVVVGNLGFPKDRVALDVTELLSDDDFTLTDVFTGDTHVVRDGQLQVSIAGHRGLALTPAEPGSEPASMPTVKPITLKGPDPSRWTVSGNVPMDPPEAVDSSGEALSWLVLGSKAGGVAAEAELKEVEFGGSLQAEFDVVIDQRFSLRVGSAGILHDGGWRISGKVDGWNTGRVNGSVPVTGKIQRMRIKVVQDQWTVTLDGQAIVGGVQMISGSTCGAMSITTWAGNRVALRCLWLTNSLSPGKAGPEALKH